MRRALFCLVPALTLMTTARAEMVVYHDQGSFLGATSIEHTETFDDYAYQTNFGSGKLLLNGIYYDFYTDNPPSLGNPDWIAGIHFGLPGYVSPPNDFGNGHIGKWTLSFGAGMATQSLGFFMSTTSAFSQAYLFTVETADGLSREYTETLAADLSRYFGFSDPEGIVSLTIQNAASHSAYYNFSVDDVARGEINAVPETSSAVLATIGIAFFALRGFRGGLRSRG